MKFAFADHKVYVHGTMATPFALLDALMKHGKDAQLKNVELIHLHLEGECNWNSPEYEGEWVIFSLSKEYLTLWPE